MDISAFNGTRWRWACGAQSAETLHLKNSTAIYLLRDHDPVTQANTPTLLPAVVCRNLLLLTVMLFRRTHAATQGRQARAYDSRGFKH